MMNNGGLGVHEIQDFGFFWTFDDKDFIKLALADADDGVRPGAA